jgi:hypothetical protein
MATEASQSQRPAQPGRPYPPPATTEPFWPAQLTVLVAIAAQLLLPARLTVGPRWLVPGFEAALLIGMFIVTPNQIEDEHPRRRRIALGLTAFVSAANIFSLGALTHYLLNHVVSEGRALIGAGVLIWITNFLIFALWYWEIDRGGPGRRSGRPTSCTRRWPTTASSRWRGDPNSSTTCTSRSPTRWPSPRPTRCR